MSTSMADPAYRRDLGNGLILRWSSTSDAAAIAQLESIVFRDHVTDPPNIPLAHFMRETMSGEYPLMGPGDFALVEDTTQKENPIVACTCLWRHQWEYEGVPFEIGRPEFVATHPNYRNRGLIRVIFELIHARSEAEGHMVQGITGIPYYYRQFGYEYALDLDGNCVVYLPFVPQAKEGTPEPYALRDATIEDLPFVLELYDRQRAAYSVSTIIDQRWWSYHFQTWHTSETGHGERVQIIVDAAGSICGYLITPNVRSGKYMPVWDLAVTPGVNLQEAMPALLRALHALGLNIPTIYDAPAVSGIRFILGAGHPVYAVLDKSLHPKYEPPYAWYVRVVDLAKIIRHIAPALERRLAHSLLGNYSGELKLDFYRGGLHIVFDKGHLANVEHWQHPVWNSESNVDGGTPPLVFLQMLFGHRSLDELRYAFPDVWVKDESELLLKTLFPRRPSWAAPLG